MQKKEAGQLVQSADSKPTDMLTMPMLVTVSRAGQLLGCGKTKIFEMINDGLLERRKLGRATRITLSSIRKIAGET